MGRGVVPKTRAAISHGVIEAFAPEDPLCSINRSGGSTNLIEQVRESLVTNEVKSQFRKLLANPMHAMQRLVSTSVLKLVDALARAEIYVDHWRCSVHGEVCCFSPMHKATTLERFLARSPVGDPSLEESATLAPLFSMQRICTSPEKPCAKYVLRRIGSHLQQLLASLHIRPSSQDRIADDLPDDALSSLPPLEWFNNHLQDVLEECQGNALQVNGRTRFQNFCEVRCFSRTLMDRIWNIVDSHLQDRQLSEDERHRLHIARQYVLDALRPTTLGDNYFPHAWEAFCLICKDAPNIVLRALHFVEKALPAFGYQKVVKIVCAEHGFKLPCTLSTYRMVRKLTDLKSILSNTQGKLFDIHLIGHMESGYPMLLHSDDRPLEKGEYTHVVEIVRHCIAQNTLRLIYIRGCYSPLVEALRKLHVPCMLYWNGKVFGGTSDVVDVAYEHHQAFCAAFYKGFSSAEDANASARHHLVDRGVKLDVDINEDALEPFSCQDKSTGRLGTCSPILIRSRQFPQAMLVESSSQLTVNLRRYCFPFNCLIAILTIAMLIVIFWNTRYHQDVCSSVRYNAASLPMEDQIRFAEVCVKNAVWPETMDDYLEPVSVVHKAIKDYPKAPAKLQNELMKVAIRCHMTPTNNSETLRWRSLVQLHMDAIQQGAPPCSLSFTFEPDAQQSPKKRFRAFYECVHWQQLETLLVDIPGYTDHIVLPATCGIYGGNCCVMYFFNWPRVIDPETGRGARSLGVLVDLENGAILRVQYRCVSGAHISYETVDDLNLHLNLNVDRSDCPSIVRFQKLHASLEGPFFPDRPWVHCMKQLYTLQLQH